MSYDPNQPRVPEGHEDGGKWTRGNYGSQKDPHAARDDHKDRQPSRGQQYAYVWPAVQTGARLLGLRGLLPSIEQPLLLPPKEQPEDDQRWTVEDPANGLAFYTWLSLRNNANRRAVIEFRAGEYVRDRANPLVVKRVRMLSREDVGDLCERLGDVETLTEKAVTKVQAKKRYWEPAEYGTAVHTALKRDINHEPDPDDPNSKSMERTPPDPNFVAEKSMWKAIEDLKAITGSKDIEFLHYAAEGTIRVDVLERVGDKTVCVYDIKTGTSFRSGLDKKRMDEIARSVLKHFPGIRRIIITEIRPKTPRPPKE